MDDNGIVDLFFNRDESAIVHTKEKYGKRIRAISFRITEDAAMSEECENDTYLEAWNRIPPSEPRTYLLAFLSRIVRNISINRCIEKERLKRKAIVIELSEEIESCMPSGCDVEGYYDGIELESAISGFLHKQSKEKRVVFMHRYFYLDSISCIAKRFGCSESKIKTMLFRMRNDLRHYLMKEGFTL